MSSPASLAEALLQCRASGVDLRVSGHGLTACMDLMAPFCPAGVEADTRFELPRCGGAAPSSRKAAALAAEAEATARAHAVTPWLVLGGGVAVLALAAWIVYR